MDEYELEEFADNLGDDLAALEEIHDQIENGGYIDIDVEEL